MKLTLLTKFYSKIFEMEVGQNQEAVFTPSLLHVPVAIKMPGIKECVKTIFCMSFFHPYILLLCIG